MTAAAKTESTKVTLPAGTNILDKSFQRLFRDEETPKTVVLAYLGVCEEAWKEAMILAKKYAQAYDKALAMIDTMRDDFTDGELKSLDGRTLKGQ